MRQAWAVSSYTAQHRNPGWERKVMQIAKTYGLAVRCISLWWYLPKRTTTDCHAVTSAANCQIESRMLLNFSRRSCCTCQYFLSILTDMEMPQFMKGSFEGQRKCKLSANYCRLVGLLSIFEAQLECNHNWRNEHKNMYNAKKTLQIYFPTGFDTSG